MTSLHHSHLSRCVAGVMAGVAALPAPVTTAPAAFALPLQPARRCGTSTAITPGVSRFLWPPVCADGLRTHPHLPGNPPARTPDLPGPRRKEPR